ncbi:hypothetical protein [Methanoculleus receptaculi]|uniref:Uncharacterized protein n=1 Tax=Methanoculleus receptaculi TaxID=394967 RepID=A0AAX4FW28_9EURY|nr:hypothetical protein [Methanoculleus receptaculi]WOX57990.1 hypothetical protein R6Y96_01670 [Methanoculleus receptaculi]
MLPERDDPAGLLVRGLPAARSPDEDRILKEIEAEYGSFCTPKGKIKAGSQPDQLQKVIPGIEAELQILYERD